MATDPPRRRASSDAHILQLLYRRYLPKLEATLRKHLRDPQRARELAHEAFLRAAERAGLANVRRLRGYLFTIARNLRSERGRADTREREILTVDSKAAARAAERPVCWSHEMSPVECAVELMRIAQRLTGRRKVVFELSLDGYENAEIALQLGISPNLVAQDLFQARREIEEMLFGHEGASHGTQH